jgi:hypothetical protein
VNATGRVVEVTHRKNRIYVEFDTADGRPVRTMIGQGDEPPGLRRALKTHDRLTVPRSGSPTLPDHAPDGDARHAAGGQVEPMPTIPA